MIRAATRSGFVPAGRLRQAAWVNGDFADEVILGLLRAEWGSSGNRLAGQDENPRTDEADHLS